jgi:hypothetical protein
MTTTLSLEPPRLIPAAPEAECDENALMQESVLYDVTDEGEQVYRQ